MPSCDKYFLIIGRWRSTTANVNVSVIVPKTQNPGSSWDRINFCSSQEGHGEEVILYPLSHFLGRVEGFPLWVGLWGRGDQGIDRGFLWGVDNNVWISDCFSFTSLALVLLLVLFYCCFLGCIKSSVASRSKWSNSPSALPWWEPAWSAVSSFGVLSTGRKGTSWSRSWGSHPDDQKVRAPLLLRRTESI